MDAFACKISIAEVVVGVESVSHEAIGDESVVLL